MSTRTGTYHHGDLKASLLGEAAAIVAESGASAVTMRELGRRLGVSRAAAYRHFEDKGALLIAVAEAGFAQLAERLRMATEGDTDRSETRLRRLGEAYIRFALDHPGHYRLMYGREAIKREDQPDLREPANALFDEFVDVIEAHQREGVIRAGDPRVLAYVAWGAVHGVASLLTEGQILAPVDVEELVDEVTRTVLEGLRG